MVVAMSAQTIYNLVDAIWVSGKGPESLSAVGFTFPFVFLAMAIANGVGIGGGAAISRKIGAMDKRSADAIATHTIVIMFISIVLLTCILLLFARPVFRFMGAGTALDLTIKYSKIIFSGIAFIFFMQVAVALLRSEGDVRRAMYAMGGGAALNIVLDPVFIYWLGLGVAGAAWATLLSMFLVSLLAFYWLFIERKTYISFKFKRFRFNKEAILDISRVGFPASVAQMSMSLMSFALTTIVASVGGPDGVAVYTTGWRVISLATLPMLGVASAVTSVTGAAFGAKDYMKLKISFIYALKTGVLAEILLAISAFVFARQITWIFTWSKESVRISGDLVLFLRILCWLLPTAAFGMLSSAMFQGVGKGFTALIMTLIRTLVLAVPFAWVLGVYLFHGLAGIWVGITASGLVYIPIAFGWAMLYIRQLQKRKTVPAAISQCL